MRYAIVENGVAINVAEADAPLAENWVRTDEAGPGWLYDGESLSPPAAPPDLRPRIVVTDVETDSQQAVIQPGDVTVPVGTTVTVSVELRAPDDSVLPLDAMFRMPLVARDGRERILLAQFVAGVADIGTTLTESGCWQIQEQTVNRDLPAEQHMRFDGLAIFVVQQ